MTKGPSRRPLALAPRKGLQAEPPSPGAARRLHLHHLQLFNLQKVC